MNDPKATLQRLEVKRARGQGFGWGLWIGFAWALGLLWLLGKLP